MKRRWSPSRVWTGVVLGAWAGLFWFLLVSGRWSLYLSTRTLWVVPTGAALLTVATVARLASARVRRPAQLQSATSWTLGLIALPVVLILSLPPATLSGYALGRRSGFVGSGVNVSTSDISSIRSGVTPHSSASWRSAQSTWVSAMTGRRGRSRATPDAVRPVKVGTRIAFACNASARSHAELDIAWPIVGLSVASGSSCR